jgi:hypothetical protein
MNNGLFDDLFPSPIDIVGDIHGEIDALQNLMTQLGYDADGVHSQGRRLVFIGDPKYRGPNSPAVVELVLSLVSRQLALCVLGNHELNLLREVEKDGNGGSIQGANRRRDGSISMSTRRCQVARAGNRDGRRHQYAAY